MTELLCLLLKPALLFLSDPRRYWYCIGAAVIGWWVDVLLAHTFWALAFGWPQGREITVSDTLERLCKDASNPDQRLFIEIAKKINRVDPLHSHIKAVL